MFAVSWLLRGNNVDFVPDSLALTLSFAGTALALVTAWIGGELVYRLGVGVDPGANVNAPNSLTAEPATRTQSKRTANRSVANGSIGRQTRLLFGISVFGWR